MLDHTTKASMSEAPDFFTMRLATLHEAAPTTTSPSPAAVTLPSLTSVTTTSPLKAPAAQRHRAERHGEEGAGLQDERGDPGGDPRGDAEVDHAPQPDAEDQSVAGDVPPRHVRLADQEHGGQCAQREPGAGQHERVDRHQ